MAVNMDSFRSSFEIFDTSLRNDLYEQIISEKDLISSTISEAILDEFPINISLIDNLINGYLMHPLEFSQNELADLISEKVNNVTRLISRSFDDAKKRKTESELTVLLNEISRVYNGNNIYNIKADFMKSLSDFLYRHGVTNFLEPEEDKFKINTSLDAVNRFLDRKFEEIVKKAKEIIREATDTYRESLKFDKKAEFSPEDLKNRMFLGAMSNYRLKTIEGSIAFVDETTNEVIKATKKDDNTFVSFDGTLEFSYGDKSWSLKEGNNVVTLDNAYVSLGTLDNPNSMKIEFGFDDATFIYNGKKSNDPETIKFICAEFKRLAPVLYEKQLAKNPAVIEAEQKSNISSINNEKFIIDENGRAHINNSNKEVLDSYLESIGYKAEEREDGVYLTDANGLTKKATIQGSSINLENGERIVVDLYRLIDKDKTQGPEIYYYNPSKEISAYIKTDFTKISVFINGDLYAMRINNGILEARASRNGEKTSDINLVTNKIKEYFPNAISKMESLVAPISKKEEGKEEPDINNQIDKYSELLAEVEEASNEEIQATSVEPALETNQEMIEMLDNRIFELSQDPRVQEYLELVKKAEELRNIETEKSTIGSISV